MFHRWAIAAVAAGVAMLGFARTDALDRWEAVYTGPHHVAAVAFGGGQYVATVADGDLGYGVSPKVVTLLSGGGIQIDEMGQTNCNVSGAAFSGGQVVAVGNATIDGVGTCVSWTARLPLEFPQLGPGKLVFQRTVLPVPPASAFQLVTYAGNTFMASGLPGILLASTNGVNWEPRSWYNTNTWWHGMAYAEGRLVAAGGGSVPGAIGGMIWRSGPLGELGIASPPELRLAGV